MVLSFSKEQFAAFEAMERDKWASKAACQLIAAFPDHFANLNVTAADLTPFCAGVEKWAARHEITGARDVLKLCYAALSLGHKFWLDPRFRGYIESTVANKRIVKTRRADAFVDRSKEWLNGLWAQDSVEAFAALLVKAVRDPLTAASPLVFTLQGVLPGHWVQYSDSDNDRAISELLKDCERYDLSRDGQCLAYVACALVFGFHWWSDPHYAAIAEVVRSVPTDTALATQLAPLLGATD